MVASPPYDIKTVTPAERKFWEEWADKAPGLLESNLTRFRAQFKGSSGIISTAVGAVLTAATFTKYIPGKWKILSGIGAAGSFSIALASHLNKKLVGETFDSQIAEVSKLRQSSELKKALAEHLATNVTAANIQDLGIEQAVASNAAEFLAQRQGGIATPSADGKSMQVDVAKAIGLASMQGSGRTVGA